MIKPRKPWRVLDRMLNSATGIDYGEALVDVGTFEIEGRTIRVIGRVALLKNKRAAGPQDLADIAALEDD